MPAGNMELVPVSQDPGELVFIRKGPLAAYRMYSFTKSDLVKMGAMFLSL